MSENYSDRNSLASFGLLVNAMDGGGDSGKAFPQSDAEDLAHGLRFIPGEVTLARRSGGRVKFVHDCQNKCCWYWEFQGGSRTYYWERSEFERIGAEACSLCGNTHISGGHIKPEDM